MKVNLIAPAEAEDTVVANGFRENRRHKTKPGERVA